MISSINKELFLFPLVALFLVVVVIECYGFLYEFNEILCLIEWLIAGAVMWVVV